MCTIVLAWHAVPGSPQVRLVLAANRDELRERPSAPPTLLAREPDRWGGQDLLAGGTWLAVDRRGRVAAVTNRHPGGAVPTRDPSRRSRGALPLDLLAGDDDAAVELLHSVRATEYNPVNLLYAGDRAAWWAASDDEHGVRVAPVAPGVHVLGEDDLDDGSEKSFGIRSAAHDVVAEAADLEAVVLGLRTVLASHHRHGAGPQTAACIHEERYGTVSSATVVTTAWSSSPTVAYAHADGAPCTTPFRDVALS
jgi:uncharacterized protein with NRDE domain